MGGNSQTVSEIADAIWDEVLAGHLERAALSPSALIHQANLAADRRSMFWGMLSVVACAIPAWIYYCWEVM